MGKELLEKCRELFDNYNPEKVLDAFVQVSKENAIDCENDPIATCWNNAARQLQCVRDNWGRNEDGSEVELD